MKLSKDEIQQAIESFKDNINISFLLEEYINAEYPDLSDEDKNELYDEIYNSINL